MLLAHEAKMCGVGASGKPRIWGHSARCKIGWWEGVRFSTRYRALARFTLRAVVSQPAVGPHVNLNACREVERDRLVRGVQDTDRRDVVAEVNERGGGGLAGHVTLAIPCAGDSWHGREECSKAVAGLREGECSLQEGAPLGRHALLECRKLRR